MNYRSVLFFSLNAVRVISIVSLALLFASTIVTMVSDVRAVNRFIDSGKDDGDCSVTDCDYIEGSTVPNQPAGAVWAVINWLLVIFQVVVCTLSEFGWPAVFFKSYFPILGPDFGLGALGVIQCLLGAAVLSHHVPELALVAAFLVFAVGCLNIVLGLVFRERAKTHRSVREWREHDREVLPTAGTYPSAMFVGRNVSYTHEKGSSELSGRGFARQTTKWAEAQGYVVREPEEAVPPYASKPSSHASQRSGSVYSGGSRPASQHEAGHEDEEDKHEHEHEREEDD